MNYKNLAVIPARAGSKGLVGKNFAYIYGKPLIAWTLDIVQNVVFFDKIVVTTDCPEVMEICKSYDVDVIKRPKYLCGDEVPLAPVIKHALVEMELRHVTQFSNIVTLQPTSPLRTMDDITNAFSIYIEAKARSLLSVREELHSIWKVGKHGVEAVRAVLKNRQELEPYYVANGAIFITKRGLVLYNRRMGGKKAVYVMNHINSIDIHDQEGLELAEFYMDKELGDNICL